jgi:sucrose phosphorylase
VTSFPTCGNVRIWTTFSADQVDLNYHNPEVLLKLDVLLLYASQGARLFAGCIAYLWKEVGTSIHLPQTHASFSSCAWCWTVGPARHADHRDQRAACRDLSYFGDGSNEAQLVYNFTSAVGVACMDWPFARALEWALLLRLPSAA